MFLCHRRGIGDIDRIRVWLCHDFFRPSFQPQSIQPGSIQPLSIQPRSIQPPRDLSLWARQRECHCCECLTDHLCGPCFHQVHPHTHPTPTHTSIQHYLSYTISPNPPPPSYTSPLSLNYIHHHLHSLTPSTSHFSFLIFSLHIVGLLHIVPLIVGYCLLDVVTYVSVWVWSRFG